MRVNKALGLLILGTAITLGGCERTEKKTERSDMSVTSIDPAQVTFGDLPTKRTDGYAFDAVYDVLIFVRFNSDGSYLARIHHFKATGDDFASMKPRMETAIGFLQDPANKDGIPPGSLNSPTLIRSFKNMQFSGQSNVLFYVDNPKISYRDIPLFFTKDLTNDQPAKKNKAFYDAAAVDLGVGGKPVKAAYFRNYFTKGGGTGPGSEPIRNPEKFFYAFNFNLNTASEDDPGRNEQLILDPDGGNMGGGGPPP